MKNFLRFLSCLLLAFFAASPFVQAQNVGIGTTDPTAKLHVVGTGKFTGNLDMSNQNLVNVKEILVTAAGGKIDMDGHDIVNVNNLTIKTGGAISTQSGTSVNFSQSTVTLPNIANLSVNNINMQANGQLQMGGGSSAVNFSQVPGPSISFPTGMTITGMAGLSVTTGNVSFTGASSVNAPNLSISTTLNAGGNQFQVTSIGHTTTNNLTVNGTYSNPSDRRFKRNIETLDGALQNVLQLRGVEYDWRRDEFPDRTFAQGHQIGFIAQELQQVYPEMVVTNDDGYLAVDYTKMGPVLVEAIKAQQAIIEGQQQELDAVKAQLAELQAQQSAFAELAQRLEILETKTATSSLGQAGE